jgi:hypothetical protein
LKGFEKVKSTIFCLLHGIKYFLHTKTKTTAGMERVEVINQEKRPHFFDGLNANIWPKNDDFSLKI